MRHGIKDFVLGVGVFAIFAIVYFFVIPQEVKVPRFVPIAANSPAFWPNAICIGVMAISFALAVKAAVRLCAERGAQASNKKLDTEAGEINYPAKITLIRVIAAMLILLAYYIVIRWIGIVVASFLALALLSFLYGERRWWLVTIIAVALPWALFFFFTDLAHIVLPMGWFG